jgi:hypothetical protein
MSDTIAMRQRRQTSWERAPEVRFSTCNSVLYLLPAVYHPARDSMRHPAPAVPAPSGLCITHTWFQPRAYQQA